ncbi:MAG: exosortase/archaeosortase family protein [Verrucomicrobiota bacterium]
MIQRLPADNTYPLLIGFVLAYWLGRPWQWLHDSRKPQPALVAFGACSFAFGLIGELLLLTALGWTILLVSWLSVFSAGPRYRMAWAMIPFFSFPWVAVDLTALGWYFRLSGAWVSEALFSFLGFSIKREGTLLDIQGLPVAIEAACAGMNLLPALLLTGAAVGFILLAGQRRYWLFLVLLFPLAWIANTLRICVITAVALTWGSQFASGFFHTWGALLVLGIMFGGCVTLARQIQPSVREAHSS